jgi:two-component system, cell cycle response regulator DivK
MKQVKILVVDKNLHDLESMNSFLKTLDITCICVKEGVRTLILAQMHQPNLIFLDTTLNDLSSIQVVNYLKRNVETSEIPIIGCIPAKTQQDVNNLLILGVKDYIRKPYYWDKVKALINNFIGWENF